MDQDHLSKLPKIYEFSGLSLSLHESVRKLDLRRVDLKPRSRPHWGLDVPKGLWFSELCPALMLSWQQRNPTPPCVSPGSEGCTLEGGCYGPWQHLSGTGLGWIQIWISAPMLTLLWSRHFALYLWPRLPHHKKGLITGFHTLLMLLLKRLKMPGHFSIITILWEF